jgi:hypothetical protein
MTARDDFASEAVTGPRVSAICIFFNQDRFLADAVARMR